MSPPEVWGPAIWRLFHTLAENINENVYKHIYPQLFFQIQRICKFLPCPECAKDASIFLAKVKLSDLKTKTDFVNIFYLFHNYVNAKKRKPLFNYTNINIYKNYRIINVVNSFISVYNTKGNMKLIAESFQRQFIIKDFKFWIMNNIKFFIPDRVSLQNTMQPNTTQQIPETIPENGETISENGETIPENGEKIPETIPENGETNPEKIPENNEFVNSSEDVTSNEDNVSTNDMTMEEIYNDSSLEETVVPTIKKKKNKKKNKN
jgi:hypothetical protein